MYPNMCVCVPPDNLIVLQMDLIHLSEIRDFLPSEKFLCGPAADVIVFHKAISFFQQKSVLLLEYDVFSCGGRRASWHLCIS